jgi:segregation and condensation protein B
VTQPEIQEIRGVSAAGVIQTLLERRLITTAGRKQVIGRPILYRTSKDFLMRFGLGDLQDLPSLKEFEALAREALGTEDGVAEGEVPGEAAEPAELAAAGDAITQGDADSAPDADAAAAEIVASTAAPVAAESETPSPAPAITESSTVEPETQDTPNEKAAAGSGAS